MAQWRGQYSGLTHYSKLEVAEAALRTSVASYQAAIPPEASASAEIKDIRRLATRVRDLRLKLLRAERNKCGPMHPSREKAMEEAEGAVALAGTNGILIEFGVAEACD
ncbi:MAG: hypothetical protein JWP89_6497 [Schlesneria sp.]|nr:hypothetical protein [Schlesneria sp.]